MKWTVLEHPDFTDERGELDDAVSDKLDEITGALESAGPNLGRPYVDTLDDSAHKNMKEIRFTSNGVWRFAFAFDTDRNAIILCGGNKEGVNQKRFYKQLIAKADVRFKDWLETEED